MSEPSELAQLRAQLEVLRAQRDSALRSLEKERAEHAQRTHLLTEEQDRFVSRLIDAHEKDVGRLSGELQEACYARDRFRKKLERARREAMAAEEKVLDARCVIDRLRTQIDHVTQANLKLTSDRQALAARVKRLSSEIEMARALMGLANDAVEPGASSLPPGTSAPPPRTSSVVGPHKVRAPRDTATIVELAHTGTADRPGRR